MFGKSNSSKSQTLPTEVTPLTEAVGKATAKEIMKNSNDLASKVMSTENMEQISQVAAERVNEMSKQLTSGNMSIRVMALAGGVSIAVFAFTGILGNIFNFKWNVAVMEMYIFVLACVMVLLESTFVKIPDVYMETIYKNLKFLKFIWGRGIMYFVVGNLQFSQGGIPNWVIGGWTMLTGIIYVLVGRNSAKKLSTMKHSIFSEQALKSKFRKADVDGNGTITLEQFGKMCDDLDLDMTKSEKEAIFFHLDTSDDNLLSYEEFSAWWNNFDASHASV